MGSTFRLSVREAKDFADLLDGRGINTDNLRAAIYEVENHNNRHTAVPVGRESDEEYLARMRSQSSIENGSELECMICHYKFEYLICGTCEVCFRHWMLLVKRG